MQLGTPTNPIVYWLDVDAVMLDPSPDVKVEFGWKTSQQHWNDDATFQIDNPNDDWRELIYPQGHPRYPDSIDMAFVITPERTTVMMLLSAGLFAAFCRLSGRRK